MVHTARALRTAHLLWGALIVGLTGCGQVLGIEDWQQAGTGGAGGDQNVSANAATGSSSAQTSSASGMTGSEVCTNGADDDADGAVDCADSDCAGYTCAPAAPTGWLGPVAVFVGMNGASLPPCGPEWASETDYLAGLLTAPDAQCSACDCGAPAGSQCTLSSGSKFTFYQDGTCTTAATSTPLLDNLCTLATSAPYSVNAYKVYAEATASGGSCAALGGTPSLQPPSFDKVARVCSEPTGGAGCAPADACVPPPPPSFRPSLCIYRPVNDEPNPTCPAGYNPLPLLYKGIADMRSCTPCQCGAPVGQTCAPVAQIFGNALSCTGGAVQTLDYCNALAMPTLNATMRVQVFPGTPQNGDCNPTGPSAPTGEAYGTSRTLACCLP